MLTQHGFVCGGVRMWGDYVRHGLRWGCSVNVFFLGFGMNREFLVCDAYAHNTALFVVVCVESVCGASMCGMDCLCGYSVNVGF